MNTTSLKNIVTLALGAIVLASLGLAAAVYYLIQTNTDIAVLTHTRTIEEKKQHDASSTTAALTTTNADIAQVTGSIIPLDGDVAFIELLESSARGHGLQIKIDSLSLADDPGLSAGMNLLQIKVEVKGTWSAVYSYMSQVESLPYSVKINMIDVVNTKDTANIDPLNPVKSAGTWQGLVDMSVLKRK